MRFGPRTGHSGTKVRLLFAHLFEQPKGRLLLSVPGTWPQRCAKLGPQHQPVHTLSSEGSALGASSCIGKAYARGRDALVCLHGVCAAASVKLALKLKRHKEKIYRSLYCVRLLITGVGRGCTQTAGTHGYNLPCSFSHKPYLMYIY